MGVQDGERLLVVDIVDEEVVLGVADGEEFAVVGAREDAGCYLFALGDELDWVNGRVLSLLFLFLMRCYNKKE